MRERAAVFILNGNKVLLIHRFKDGKEYYAVPGGGIEQKETAREAAIREIKEETGLDIILEKELAFINLDGCMQHFYFAKTSENKVALGGPENSEQSPTNIHRLEWIPIETLNEINLRKEIRDLLLQQAS